MRRLRHRVPEYMQQMLLYLIADALFIIIFFIPSIWSFGHDYRVNEFYIYSLRTLSSFYQRPIYPRHLVDQNLNDENLPDFITEWEEWSRVVAANHKYSELDSCFELIFNKYYDSDSSRYIVLPYLLFKEGPGMVTPVIKNASKPILYLSNDIEGILYPYINECSDSSKSILKQFIPVNFYEWGGLWFFETFPVIYCFWDHPDGKEFFLRKNKNTLEKILIPNDPDKSPEVLGDFVQVSKSRYYQVR